MAVAEGGRIGPYEIGALLGAGGMGEVYRAHDPRIGRDVAIKFLLPRHSQDPESLLRFEQEVRLIGLLNHPNILAVHDVGSHDGAPYIVAELLQGATLRHVLRDGPLPLRKALDYALQIARGLAAAHAKSVIHRDLKPENVIVTTDGQVKILDFGLAKLIEPAGHSHLISTNSADSPTRLTREGLALGTLEYMAPEQLRDEGVDYRTDIFAFGATLYEMLTGRAAFRRETPVDTVTAILKEDPPSISSFNAFIPPMLERTVQRCLEKAPALRYQSVSDLAFQLETLQDGKSEPAAAVPKHRPWLLFAGAAMLLALVMFGVVTWRQVPDSVAPSFSRVVRLTSTPYLESGPALSPDGKWVAYLADGRGVLDVWVKFIAGGEASNLTALSGLNLPPGNNSLEISPDGTSIAFRARSAGTGTDVWLIPAPLGGAPRRVLQNAAALRWSPNAQQIAFFRPGATAGDTLIVADADGANDRVVVNPRRGVHIHYPAWSDDGRYIYFVQAMSADNTEPSQVFRVAASGGGVEPVIRTARRAIYPVPTPDGRGLIYAANPFTSDLNLWWRGLPDRGEEPIRLTTGVGNYEEPRVSADGSRMVSTFVERRQLLVTVPVGDDANKSPRPVTDGYNSDLDPNLSPQGDRIVFSSAASGNRQLWTASPSGTDRRPLTSGGSLDDKPVFSPDGKQVAFISDRGGERGVWTVSAKGGAPSPLIRAPVIDAMTWSPDGQQVAFAVAGEQSPELWVVSVASKGVRKLPVPSGASVPAWSPNEDTIALLEAQEGLTEVTFVNSQGQPRYQRFHLSSGVSGGSLAWAPDGRRLAAVASLTLGETLWIVEPEGDQPPRQLLKLSARERVRGITWTPDGSSLIIGKEEMTSDIVLFER